ncbi:uncharacterized protein PHACADRAFT_169675 [Phanerochaete carnosa HHB-10118-sp]|uniref:FMP27 GFWDK domain-containing protein n=1 Tax=Phanerochaete carnosa (strain HHB-10118-sp) TaxID=650164 RepID=K5WII9_PHACS|nr:uncharacterized protein PHACADRAFT_169675 [Phanerochaete carnosa HHB-10118-sp]EKM59200.1 hypothetical protein PHACADRAFT_169675 [Phanerochaete carnosa HHB-10118-sp]
MSLLQHLSSVPLFFSTLLLWKPKDSTLAYLVIWLLRIIIFSLLFRSFLGPTILRLVSRRLRVQSVSLRSIRGIYFRAGNSMLHIDRIGLSYHKPSALDASRFSIRVEGFRLELAKTGQQRPLKRSSTGNTQKQRVSVLDAYPALQRALAMLKPAGQWVWSSLEPYVRPTLRAAVVSVLRVMIRALPTLTQVLDLEINSAIVSSSVISGAELVVRKAKFHTSVAFTQLDNSNTTTRPVPVTPTRAIHRRLASVANFNTRVKNSLRRTWGRAWGSTQVAVALSLNIHEVLGVASDVLLEELKSPIRGRHAFFAIPQVAFATSVRLNPRQQVERHGLDISFGAGPVNLDVEVVQHILDILKALRKPSENDPSTPPRPVPSPDGVASPASMASPGDIMIPRSITSPQSAASPPFSSPPLSPRSSILWASPLSPNSPLMGALSVSSLSARFRWREKHPSKRIQARKAVARISMLKAIRINFPSVTLVHHMTIQADQHTETFTANLEQIAVNVDLSHPDRISLHREHLGRTSAPGDPLTADVYQVSFSVEHASLDRMGAGAPQDRLRVLSVGPLKMEVLISQWPSPWLQGPSFLSGDPNAQFLIARLSLGNIEITGRLEIIKQLLDRKKLPRTPSPSEPPPLLPPVLYPVPRLSFGFHVGDICVRLIGSEETSPFALETRTSGFVATFDTAFQVLPDSKFTKVSPDPDRPRLRMRIDGRAELHRTFISIVRGPEGNVHDAEGATGGSLYPGEPLVSLDTVQFVARGHGFGELADEAGEGVAIDAPSLFLDTSCSTEALSVELWQPDAMAALKIVLTSISSTEQSITPPTPSNPKYLLSALPAGISTSFAIGRFMVFIAGPDLAPGEDMAILRGVAFHTGIGFHYCSLRDTHSKGLADIIPRTQKRLQLSLATELLSTAAGGTGAATLSQSERALVEIVLWDTALRDALATRYVADDPFGVGDISEDYRSKEYLRVEQVTVGAVISGRRLGGIPMAGTKDDCAVSVAVSRIRGSVHLAHAYNLLLAAEALKNILPPPKPRPPVDRGPSTLSVALQCHVDRVQLLWKFPLRMKLYMRITNLTFRKGSNGKLNLGWESILLSVPVSVERDGAIRPVWEELARLLKFSIDIQPDIRPMGIIAEGHSARLRIPFDYVLADLILDINITLKSMKHLVRMVPTGQFFNPPTPEAEDAKIVPNVSLRLGCLCAEAADDPFEARLGLIWRTGFDAARIRSDRDGAFEAKATTILAARGEELPPSATGIHSDFQFTSEHTISIEEARLRLNQVHSGVWISRFKQARVQQIRQQQADSRRLYIKSSLYGDNDDDLVPIVEPAFVPPMFRLKCEDLNLKLAGPSFTVDGLPDFLYKEGGGMPKDMKYSLLIPMHLNFSVSSLRLSSREYPLPLLNIPAHSKIGEAGLIFDSNVVIAEEMGTEESVEWVDCAIVRPHAGLHGASPLYITIPKTIMPVKTYAHPHIRVNTDDVTDFAWGLSYGPVTQDIMRVVDTLSHAPRDSSPAIGFWDKLRLVFHWRFRVTFENEVHLHMKGSNDPHALRGPGSGFALCWEGSPTLRINHPNPQHELIQLTSESLMIIVPNVEESYGETSTMNSPVDHDDPSSQWKQYTTRLRKTRRSRKVVAKFGAGSRFGVGISLERSCDSECIKCTGDAFHRHCRFFDSKPHFAVKLEKKDHKPLVNSAEDSYAGFRSDFIHLALSLTSGLQVGATKHSSIHLSPSVFAQFWSWWTLFDGKSLPIRQGRRYKHKRPLSPKFGQHLATIKYRIEIPRLFLSHVYMDESQDAWTDGVTPFVGLKASIGRFTADMHQRAQESVIAKPDGTTKTVTHKPFYAVEVVLDNMELRTMLAIFQEPLKQRIPLEPSQVESTYRTREGIPATAKGSKWIDMDDFIDLNWSPSSDPEVHDLLVGSCPRFTYFKRHYLNQMKDRVEYTKFGDEDSHECFLGKEASVPRIQMAIALERIEELQNQLTGGSDPCSPGLSASDKSSVDTKYMISLLEGYVAHLKKVDAQSQSAFHTGPLTYYMPADSVSPDDWANFDNVYQVHCPNLYLDNIIRDIIMQYYHCSRSHRGFEYHMATRAVKFIRDQALAAIANLQHGAEEGRHRGSIAATSAQAAAQAVRKILGGGDDDRRPSVDISVEPNAQHPDIKDPLKGWSEGVSLSKAHFCLLLKPQIVLRSETSTESVCVLAAVQGKLQSYHILDDANVDDPISGRVMSRNFASLTGLQAFSPSAINKFGQGVVPLEVLIDLKCGTNFFDRLVPQTDATLQYDKFNRLRLRNNVNSVTRKSSDSDDQSVNHLESQNDLVRIHVPRFTVTANDRHFQAISNIVTNLILFSDAAHKMRADRLEKMLFSYDFTNLASAADVVAKLQYRLRLAVETRREAERKLQGHGELGEVEKLKIDAHILLLAEELDYVFEAIKLAQDKADGLAAQKSALLLHASSSEISWRMIDRHEQLLAKLAMRDIDFHWLNRQDSSTVNNLLVGDLQAFDGAADAEWTEILSKYDEPASHPLVKRKLFCVAEWTVLPPVGGITIYQSFELSLHPMRLQIDSRVGRRIMEYVWPARRRRQQNGGEDTPEHDIEDLHLPPSAPSSPVDFRSPLPTPSVHSPAPRPTRRASADLPSPSRENTLTVPGLRKTPTSRSFTDLRKVAQNDALGVPRLEKTKSSDALFALSTSSSGQMSRTSNESRTSTRRKQETDDAAVMKTRSSQKTFVWVKVSSLHLLLSIMKENSFFCRDARIRTRDLEYRNQTCSFEELVDQFIPSGRNWKGWVKIAFNQPLVPVLPVAREIISKTKWVSKGHNHQTNTPRGSGAASPQTRQQSLIPGIPKRLRTISTMTIKGKQTPYEKDKNLSVSALGLMTEPESMIPDEVSSASELENRKPKRQLLKVFKRRRSASRVRSSMDSTSSVSVMHSVRVKRGQYNPLPDVYQGGGQGRPRSRSLATVLGSPRTPAQSVASPPTPQFTPQPEGSGHARPRSHTTAVPSDRPPLSGPSTPRMTSSKIQTHIMNRRHADSYYHHQHPDVVRGKAPANESTVDGRQRRGSIALEGSAENVVYRGNGDHFGMIGSALSACDGEVDDKHHEDDIVEHLDVIDPAIATVSTLTNAANAIVIPPLDWYSRKCTVVLPDVPVREPTSDAEKGQMHEDNLDRHVEDVLSKRDRYRRIASGVWAFMKTPMGIIVTIYGFLVVFWGTGIVLFLARMINLHNKNDQDFWVELCQQVETGLFTATSIGLIPFRVLDTWRVTKIWRYQRITIKRRKKAGIPDLYDNNDLPDPLYDENHIHVLTDKEQADLHYQQHKFMQSQTWYRPHGTSTHRAFPIELALWICVMNDLNSFFQCLLSACMWSMDRFERPAWTTATTLPAAFVSGIVAGVLIWQGGKKTRRHEQVEQRLRAALAMEKPIIRVTDGIDSQASLPGVPELRTGTSDSTPTLTANSSPRSKDYLFNGESSSSDLRVEEMPRRQENPRLMTRISEHHDSEQRSSAAAWSHRASVGSSRSVPIAEQMTVPAAEDLYDRANPWEKS